MTFKEWEDDHVEKVEVILKKLEGESKLAITNYFDYDNMVKMEPDFCPLYATNTKCHDIDSLNCFLCSCPFFKYSDDLPLRTENGIDVMSVCVIDSNTAGTFTQNGKQQCDCSGCHIPHKKRFVKRHLEAIDREIVVGDAISTLEWLRGLQLSEILGKWKLF